MIVFDDVGWGDFGCYGGGVAVGAPTPNIDRLARQGLLLTSCYSEPSCTPSRASLMTGRLPMRHGLLRPPMYGEPGGLEGEITIAQLLADAGYVTQAVGKWHMGENEESASRRTSASTTSTGSSASRTCTPSGATRTSSPRSCTARSARAGSRTSRSTSASCTRRRRSPVENVEEVTIPVLSELDDKWATYSLDFVRRMAGQEQPWFLYHCTRGAHFDNYPHERFLGSSPAKHPYKDTIIELDDIVGRLVADARGDRPARGHARLRHLGQRTGDGDLARRRVLAVPQRQGLDLGRRPAGAGHRLLAGDDRRRIARRTGSSRSWTGSRPCCGSPAPRTRCPTTATSTASTRPRSCSRPIGLEPQVPLLLARFDVLGGPCRLSTSSCWPRPRTTTATC